MAMDLRFITGIRWYKDTLNMLNNMTYIYDPKWNQNNSTKATLPVAFYHVKSCHEVMSSEVSQKQMLFYNSALGDTTSDPALDSGLLNVVADNIVIKPKTYKMDIVVPYHNLTLLDQSFVYNTHTAQAVTSVFLGGKKDKNASNVDKAIASWSTLCSPFLSFIKGLLNILLTADRANSAGLDTILRQPEYNKDSLETMWRLRRILKMKMWNSWQYKYVSIIDLDITKEGDEDGVYEATMTVQEMPIISMYPEGRVKKAIYTRKNPLLDKRGEIAISVLDKAGGGIKE